VEVLSKSKFFAISEAGLGHILRVVSQILASFSFSHKFLRS